MNPSLLDALLQECMDNKYILYIFNQNLQPNAIEVVSFNESEIAYRSHEINSYTFEHDIAYGVVRKDYVASTLHSKETIEQFLTKIKSKKEERKKQIEEGINKGKKPNVIPKVK